MFLEQNGADSALRNFAGASPLDLASQYGRIDTVRLLLSHNPGLARPVTTPRLRGQSNSRLFQVHQTTEASSALHLAARNGHINVVQLLLQHHFNVNTVVRTCSQMRLR